MAEMIEPFEFKQSVSLLKSTGKKAKNLRELRNAIAVDKGITASIHFRSVNVRQVGDVFRIFEKIT